MLTEIKNGNVVEIDGIVSEIDLKKTPITRDDGSTATLISGTVKVRVDTEINGENTTLEIPVNVYTTDISKNGKPIPSYKDAVALMEDFVSIAASDIDRADRVRISGKIGMNEYYNKNGQLVSFPRISGSFFRKMTGVQGFEPRAQFSLTAAVGQIAPAVDAEGVETGDYRITAIVPLYNGKVDIVPITVKNRGAIDAVLATWSEGDTVVAGGKLNFSTKTEITTVPVAFGEPTVKSRTTQVSELVLTQGSQPLDADFAINEDDIREALIQHKADLAEKKAKAEQRQKANSSPVVGAPIGSTKVTAPAKKFMDIDF